ncbi:MAG: ATP-dependent RecD-like DNA helicase [Myxococcales bacterium]|nr:ATP-dependent RecD-like DNA helicase [Myxococcales bacterium]HRC55502.1 ATP-dependent RecD-like DNA helicase [Kofleriaceae bacterium]
MADPVEPSAPAVTLDGTVERFVYRDQDSHFTVARFSVEGDPLGTTIVGELVNLTEGVPLRLHGQWVQDRKWGRQFRVESYQLKTPETLVGIERFLGSGLIPGVGAELARRMVEKFGMDTLEIIGRAPERLTEVSGIGASRAKKIAEAWFAQHHVQDVMVFLRGHGVSPAFAARIVKRYGKDAINVVRENPYRLAREVWGIGFRTADGIAQKLGIARDADSRVEAGLLHVLDENLEQGHLHLPDELLVSETATLLEVAAERVRQRLAALVQAHLVVPELLGSRGSCSSLPWVHATEVEAASLLAELVKEPTRFIDLDVDEAISAFEVVTAMELAPQQRHAVRAALQDKCVVITGGPGVGKTTIVRAISHLSRLGRRKVALAAPTGRAAKRLAEATGLEAMTIHRLLEYQPQTQTFGRGKLTPLEADLIVVDEASMIDLTIFHALLLAVRPAAQLVLVGDIDQLPSVGAGAVLGDVISSEAATVIRLTEIFRQAAESRIVVSAHQINAGALPDLSPPAAGTTETSDFYFISREEPQAARATVVELVAERIPARFGLDPFSAVQVLTPMHRGELGTQALNAALQARLNPAAEDRPELTRGERVFRLGDKVMQLRNDYDRGVYNGDIGVVSAVVRDDDMLRVDFGDTRIAEYERAELDQLVLAYAVSVHKSQGSEYPAVVIPVATQHYMMLQRSLLYTAVTRGKRLVVLVGSKKAVGMAVRNAAARQRFTYLAERLRQALA